MGATNPTAIKAGVERTAKKAAYSPLMEAMARLGFGVRGLIYITMGLLALIVVFGKGGGPTNQQGAIAAIGKQPAGMIFLWVILIGLVCYALWGVIRAIYDPLHKGHDLKGWIVRVGYMFSAVSYAFLAIVTRGYITGAGNSAQSGAQTQQSLSTIMSKPWGPWAIGLVGLVFAAVGLYQVYQGFNASFDKQFQTYAMTAKELKWGTQLGRLGTATRGVIFAIIGGSLFMAAAQSNPSQPIGIDAALSTLQHQPYGIWLLGIAAVGLIAFGIFSMLSAVWFRLKR